MRLPCRLLLSFLLFLVILGDAAVAEESRLAHLTQYQLEELAALALADGHRVPATRAAPSPISETAAVEDADSAVYPDYQGNDAHLALPTVGVEDERASFAQVASSNVSVDAAAARAVLVSLGVPLPPGPLLCSNEMIGCVQQGNESRIFSMIVSNGVKTNATTFSSRIGELTELRALGMSTGHLNRIPDELGQCTKIRTLSMSRNRISVLPDSICNLTGLATLSMDSNLSLRKLPDCMANMSKLTALHLGGNALSQLPPGFGRNATINYLDLSHNLLTDLSAFSADVRASSNAKVILAGNFLEEVPPFLLTDQPWNIVDLGSNQLTALPDAVCTLFSVHELLLGNNRLEKLPDCIGELRQLTVLDIIDNALVALPSSFSQLSSMHELSASNNQLLTLPHDIGNMTGLTAIRVDYNRLTSVPASVCKLSFLRGITIKENSVTALPDCLSELRLSLTEIDAAGNQLSELPYALRNCTILTELKMARNQFTRLPEIFDWLMDLNYVDFSDNQLTELPTTFFVGPRAMSALFLDNNRLQTIDESIGNLIILQHLHLAGNLLTEIPDAVYKMPSIEILDVSSNLLTEIRANAWSPSLAALDASSNRLHDVPRNLTSYTKLAFISLAGNVQLSGPLPLLPPAGVQTVLFPRCNFSESVPMVYASVSTVLELSGNIHLEDVLGPWVCDAGDLQTLVLSQMNISSVTAAGCESDHPLLSLTLLDISKNNLGGESVALLLSKFVSPALKSLDVSYNPVRDLTLIALAVPFESTLQLTSLNMRATEIQWLMDSSGAAVYSPQHRVALFESVTGVLDLSQNMLRLMLNPGTSVVGNTQRFHAQQVICEECLLSWGPSSVIASDPFGFDAPALLSLVSSVRTKGTPYFGKLPAPDNVPHLQEIDINSEHSRSSSFDGDWEVIASDESTVYGSYKCPSIIYPVRDAYQGYRTTVHPNFYSYRLCRCLSGYFGVVKRFPSPLCRTCPENGKCEGEGRLRIAGQWAVWTDSEDFLLVECPGTTSRESPCKMLAIDVFDDMECINKRKSGCRATQWADSTVTCRKGHDASSRLCSKCQDGYYASGRLCSECTSSLEWMPPTVYIGKVVVVVLFLGLGRRQTDSSLRIFATHLSLFAVMTDSSVNMPGMLTVLDWTGSVGSGGSMPGLECLSSQATFENKFYFTAALPLVVLFVAVVFWVFARVLGKTAHRKRAVAVFLFLWLTYFLSFLRRVFSVINCSDFGASDGKSFIMTAMWIPCTSKSQWPTMRLVALVVGSLVLAATILGLCFATYAARDSEDSERRLARLGFLFAPYRTEFYYWELLITARHTALGLTLALCTYGSILLPVLIFVVLFLSLVIHIYIKPYRSQQCNRMETVSISSLLVGFFALVVVEDMGDTASTKGTLVSIVVLNLIIVIGFAALIAHDKVAAGRRLWRRMRGKVVENDDEEGDIDYYSLDSGVLRAAKP